MRSLILIFFLFSNLQAQESGPESAQSAGDPFSGQSLESYKDLFSHQEQAIADSVKIMRDQLNIDQMFEGREHLKGDPAKKPNGVEDLLNLSLSSLRIINPRLLEQMILEQTKGGVLHGFLAKDYQSLSFIVKVIQDPRVIPRLGRIADQRAKVYIFLAVVVLSFLGLFFYKRKLFKNRGFFDTLPARFMLCTGVTLFRLVVLVVLFHEELTPFYELIRSHWAT